MIRIEIKTETEKDKVANWLVGEGNFEKHPFSEYDFSKSDYRTTDEMYHGVNIGFVAAVIADVDIYAMHIPQNFSYKDYEEIRTTFLNLSSLLKRPISLDRSIGSLEKEQERIIHSVSNFPEYPFIKRHRAEAGCFHAYFDFQKKLNDFKKTISIVQDSIERTKLSNELEIFNPLNKVNQYVIPFLSGIYEAYMKDTVRSLWYHSSNAVKTEYEKHSNDKSSKLTPIKTVKSDYEIHARHSVLNLKNLLHSFCILLEYINMYELLGVHTCTKLSGIIDGRHFIAHRASTKVLKNNESLWNDLEVIEVAVEKLYSFLVEKYG